MMDLPDLLRLYEGMLRIRYFEEEAGRRLRAGEMYGEIHQYIGQEAVAVGVCAALEPTDVVTSTHRGHGHIVARGGDLYRIMAELYGRGAGYCRGKGGSLHVADVSLGIYGANGIVGGSVPHAVGAAFAAKLRHENRVAVAFFGDGAINQGVVHESLNLAAIFNLPVIFVCENNSWAVSFSIRQATAINDLVLRAGGYGIPGRVVDGMDVVAVFENASETVDLARNGHGPQFVEAKTYRYEGHYSEEERLMGSRPYRTKEELAVWRAKDPIANCKRIILSLGICDEPEINSLEEKCRDEVVTAASSARSASPPQPSEAYEDLYATPLTNSFPRGW
jgi:acetoin:2,6-dichlorophenolindophenol oxidoreductase subunit alpha